MRLSLWFPVLFVLLLFSCNDNCTKGEGSIVQMELELDSFTGVELRGSTNVTITQGPEQVVVADGQQNIIDRVRRNVVNGVWVIDLEGGCYRDFDLQFFVTLPVLDQASISGSGNMTIGDFDYEESENELFLEIDGSGVITIGETTGVSKLTSSISGSGNITILDRFTGLNDVKTTISGSGNYSGFLASSLKCTATVSGSGNCEVSAEDELIVNISGSGNVLYKGNPEITVDISGSGELINAN